MVLVGDRRVGSQDTFRQFKEQSQGLRQSLLNVEVGHHLECQLKVSRELFGDRSRTITADEDFVPFRVLIHISAKEGEQLRPQVGCGSWAAFDIVGRDRGRMRFIGPISENRPERRNSRFRSQGGIRNAGWRTKAGSGVD